MSDFLRRFGWVMAIWKLTIEITKFGWFYSMSKNPCNFIKSSWIWRIEVVILQPIQNAFQNSPTFLKLIKIWLRYANLKIFLNLPLLQGDHMLCHFHQFCRNSQIVIFQSNFHQFLKSQWVLESILNQLQDSDLSSSNPLRFYRVMKGFS